MRYAIYAKIRRKKSTATSISLFPFLAVLICTMGALVPLLLAVSRTARLQAQQAAAAKIKEASADVRAECEMAQFRVDQLKITRKEMDQKLADMRLRLGHVEEASQKISADIDRYKNEIESLERGAGDDRKSQEASAVEIEDLRRRLADAEKKLTAAEAEEAGKKRSFAIVPYTGPNGTSRRPIYIECRAESVIVQPEGIRLASADFDGPMGPTNPLATALRGIREYWLSHGLFNPDRDGEPYPLMLVRPDGVEAYYAARSALKSWGTDFGYELVEADWNLAYPQRDAIMTELVERQVAESREIQRRLIASAPREYERARPTYRVASNRGGVVRDNGGDSDRPGPGGPRGGSSGGDARGGYVASKPGNHYGGAPTRDDDDDSLDAETRRDKNNEDAFSSGVANPYLTMNRGGEGASGVPGAGLAGGGGNGNGGGYSGGSGVGGGSGGATGYGVAGGGGNGVANGVTGYGNGGGSAEYGVAGGNGYSAEGAAGQSGGAGTGQAASAGQNAAMGGPYDGNSQTATAGQVAGSVQYGTNGQAVGSQNGVAQNGASQNGAGQYGSVQNGASQTGSAAGQYAAARNMTGQGTAASAGMQQKKVEGYVPGKPLTEADIAAADAAARAYRKNPDAMASGQPLRPGEWIEKQKERDEPAERPEPPKHGKEDLAKKRGQDWGLRNQAKGSVPVTRPIAVECYPDRLVVVSERGPVRNKTIPLGPRTEMAADALISAVWDVMDDWGIAGRGMYWKPVLKFRVAPGGENRFTELQQLLENSGLAVEQKI